MVGKNSNTVMLSRVAAVGLLLAGMHGMHADAQTWSVGKSYPVVAAQIGRVVVGSVMGPTAGDVVVVADRKLLIYMGDMAGNLSLAATQPQMEASDVAVGPFSGTSRADDLIVLGSVDGGPSGLYLLTNTGSGELNAPVAVALQSGMVIDNGCHIVRADLNGDAYPDLIVTCATAPTTAYVGINSGTGVFRFTPVAVAGAGRTITEISSGDVNGDGLTDLLVRSVVSGVEDTATDAVWLGRKSGGYGFGRNLSVAESSSVLADYDGDTLADQVVKSNADVTLSRNLGQGQFAPGIAVAADDGCSVDKFALGRLQTMPSDRHIRSKASDLVFVETCSGAKELAVRLNTAGTYITISPVARFHEARYKVRVTVTVASFSGTVVPTGAIMFAMDNGVIETKPLVKGAVSFPVQLKKGANWAAVGYVGDGTVAASTGLGYLKMPNMEGRYPDPPNKPTPMGYRYRTTAPWRFRQAVMNTASRAHLLEVAQTYTSYPPIFVGPYVATVAADTLAAWGANGAAPSSPLSGSPAVGTNYVLETQVTYGFRDDAEGMPGLSNAGVAATFSLSDGGSSIMNTQSFSVFMYLVTTYLWDSVGGCYCDQVTGQQETDYWDVSYTFSTPGSHTINGAMSASSPLDFIYYDEADGTPWGLSFSAGSAQTTVTVTGKATPTITWATPAAIIYGTALSGAQLDASASVGGSYAYTPAAGTVLGAGSQTLSVLFTPSDTTDYNTATTTATLVVNKATPTLSVSCSPNPITYGPQTTNCTSSISGGTTGTESWTINGAGWTSTGLNGSAGGFANYAAGTYTIGVSYAGDSDNNAVSTSTTLTINPVTPTVTATIGSATVVYGQSTTVSVQVSCNSACGTVDYRLDGGEWGAVALSGSGSMSAVSVASWPVGTHTLQVLYSGNGNYNAASSNSVTLTIVPAPTTTSISSTLNPTVVGQNVSWPCTVSSSAGTPTGTISYTYNGTFAVSSTVPGGAAWGGTGLSVGTYVIVCSFAAQGNFAASSSSVTQVVNALPTVTTVSSSQNPSTYGQSVTLSSMVNTGGVAPTGSVTFNNGASSVGTGTISTVSTTNLIPYSAGINTMGGGGWVAYPAVAAPDGSNTVVGFNSQIGDPYLFMSSLPVNTYTFSVWLEAPAGTGPYVVNIYILGVGGTACNVTTVWQRCSVTATTNTTSPGIQVGEGNAPLVYAWGAQLEQASSAGPYVATNGAVASGYGGLATLTTSTLPVGTDSVTAVYGGDANDAGSTSPVLSQVVTKVTPTLNVSCSPNPVPYGSYFSCSASVSNGATGTVTVIQNGGMLGTYALSGGVTTYQAGNAIGGVGAYVENATYNGDANNSPASGSTTLMEIQATQAITFTAPSSPVAFGVAPIALNASATSGLAVTFAVISGPGTISGSTLTITGDGTVVVAANQAGNANIAAAAQVAQSVVVNQLATVTTLVSTLNPSTVGQGVTFSSLVNTGGVAPSGTVTFNNGGMGIGTGTVSTVSATNLIRASTGGVNGANWSAWDYPSTTHTLSNAAAPDGTNSAVEVTSSGVDHTVVQQNPSQMSAPYSSVAGHTYTFSVWARSTNGCNLGLGIENSTVWESSSLSVPVTSAWQRVSITYTFSNPSDSNEVDSSIEVPAGCTVQLWGYQFEEAAQQGPYVATNGATATGYGGLATFTTSGLPAGSDAITAAYGGDANNAASASTALTQVVTQATPMITWATPAAIMYGTALSATQLNASASVGGTFTYTPAAGTVLSAGSQTLSVTFTPTDTTDYSTATATVSLTVNKANTVTTGSLSVNPVTYGQTFSAPVNVSCDSACGSVEYILDGTEWGVAVLDGAGDYNGAAGVLAAGTHIIQVNYLGDANHNPSSWTAPTLTIIKATPTLTWAPPAAITIGTPLSGVQLDANASVGGTFTYTPAAGSVLGAGSQTLSVLFTPTDATDYATATTTVPLAVVKENAGMTLVSTINPSIYGETITVTVTMTGTGIAPTGSVTVMDGATNLGVLALTPAGSASTATLTTSTLGAGTNNFSVSYSGDSNYN